jgi:1,4-dihydroxy-2-naphthoate polyprenyltransferase
MTHFINEYGDYEVDKLNANAGSWTGGSKVLREGLLPRNVALNAGEISLVLSIFLGTACVLRFVTNINGSASSDLLFSDPSLFFKSIPWSFVLLGFSVFAVAIAYSVEPFKLSSHALGELCVSYVLTFVTPSVGILSQGGHLDWHVVYTLLPLFIVNANRMVVMNIPDRDGDEEGGKNTSVVLLGEDRAVILHNIVTLVTYFLIVPLLPLAHSVRVAYYSVLPIRWWQSLRLNSPSWWRRRDLTDSIPFVESMYVLSTGVALCLGLLFPLLSTST